MKHLIILPLLAFGSGQAASLPATVTLALDWVPNVNHIGVYVALANGWYKQANITLRVLPYGATSPDVLVAAGRADVGVSSAEGVTSAAASGQPVVSIAAIYTTSTAAFAVLAKSGIQRPRDLDGKVYAAFGAPYETPIIKRLIMNDGGRGAFNSPVLNTFGLDALLSGKADFMWIFEGVEGVEARRKGFALRHFPLTKFGIPDAYTPVFTARPDRLAPDREKLRAFLRATARGYEFARTHPQDAAALMLRSVPKTAFPDPGVLREGVQYFVDRGAYARPGHSWGWQTQKMWTDYPRFLLRSGAVRRPNGQPASTLNYAALFTNTLLSPSH